MTPLSRRFYERPTLEVARDLLGKHLLRRSPEGALLCGRIVEVEAYLGLRDRASHARLRRKGGEWIPTERTAVMFGPAGHAYVYLVYGMHNCMNVVAHPRDEVGAILLRALEPDAALQGQNLRGPARLCAVFGIDRSNNGLDLTQKNAALFIATGEPVSDDEVVTGPRIGVEYAGEDALLPYRYLVKSSRHLSRPIAGAGRRQRA
jgi:DNA-3-methyladenine glycosylase